MEKTTKLQNIPWLYTISPMLIQGLSRLILRPLLFHFAKFEVRGLDNIPANTPIILTPNHTSEFDPVLLSAAFPHFSKITPIFYVSDEKRLYKKNSRRALSILYGGNFFKIMGAYPVKRGLKNYAEALRQHVQFLNHNKTLCIFPEGKLTRTGGIQEARGGVGYLADVTNAVVIPVSITGTWNFNIKDFFLKKIHINIYFGKPFYSHDIIEEGLDVSKVYKKGANKIMLAIREKMSILNE